MSADTETWAQTACILCECNCGIEVQLDGRTLSRIRGDNRGVGHTRLPAARGRGDGLSPVRHTLPLTG